MSEIKSTDIDLVSVKELLINPKNNNKHPKEQIDRLAALIEYQGFRNPIIVSNRTGMVVAGHGRLAAAKKLKMKQVPVICQDFKDEVEEYAYMTSDNAIASWATLDLSMVNAEMVDLGPELDIEMLGLKDFMVEPADKFDSDKEWDGMPEFNQEDKTSFRHVIVHFVNEDDAADFFRIIGQNDTGKTKSIWFPPQENMDTEAKRYG